MKKLIALILLVSLATICGGISIHAANVPPETPVSPMWDKTASVTLHMDKNTEPECYASAYIVGKDGTTSITIYITVYKQVGSSWEYVTASMNASASQSFYHEVTFDGESNGYYKAEYQIRVFHGAGNFETITDTMYLTY